MKKYLLFGFMVLSLNCFSQNRTSVWCFGDSAGIDFSNLNNPIPIITGMDSRGSCCSVSDTSGNLLFYASTRAGMVGKSGLVWSNNNSVMMNGDSIVGQGWYNEMIIVPFPQSDS